MTLSLITYTIAAAFALIGVWALALPAAWRTAMQKFPRYTPAGWVFTVISIGWFAWNINASPLGGLDVYKRALWIVAPTVIYLIIRYMDELLAPRALGGFLLLVPGTVLDASRIDYSTPYRLVMVIVAYGFVVIGCYLVAGPHRFRLWLASPIASDTKARRTGASLVALALGLAAVAYVHYGAAPSP